MTLLEQLPYQVETRNRRKNKDLTPWFICAAFADEGEARFYTRRLLEIGYARYIDTTTGVTWIRAELDCDVQDA